MHQYYVGLDAHSKQSTFVVADEAGTIVAEGEVPTTPAGLKELCERQALAAGRIGGINSNVIQLSCP